MSSSFSRRSFLGGLSAALVQMRAEDDKDPNHGVSGLIEGGAMVRIRPGHFPMGSDQGNPDEQPVHRVTISHEFDIGKFEVTQAQWQTVMTEAHPSPGGKLLNSQGAEVSRTPSHFRGDSLPVESVSWDDVQLFLDRINQRDPKHAYRLPTEAEWEYCARGGSVSNSWNKANSAGVTHRVGEKQATNWGLYDMHGNVAEWVHDWYSREYYEETPTVDPAGPRTGSYRVYRGGSWLDDENNCRTSYRGFDFPVNRFYNVGFRVLRTLR